MEMLFRSMSPYVIALDELGNPDDVSTILQVLNAGVRLLVTAHGYDVQRLRGKAWVPGNCSTGTFSSVSL